MDYGWSMFFWFVLALLAAFTALSWWPAREHGRDRKRRAGRGPSNADFDSYPPYMDWDYPYGMGYMRYANRHRHRGRGPRAYQRSDERIAEDVNDRLMIDGEVDATDVAVRVSHGKVELFGSVPTRAEKRLAEWIADSVPGVTDVDNALEVRAGARETRDEKTAS